MPTYIPTILKLIPVVALITNVVKSQSSNSKFGCYFDNGLCNENEFCFDDALLGQCLTKDNPQKYLREIPPLSQNDKDILSLELEKLTEGGFAWTDVFTQCVLQNILDSFQFGTPIDESTCSVFLEDAGAQDLSLEEDEEGNDEDDSTDDGGMAEEMEPEDAMLVNDQDDGITSVVPKKMVIQDPDTKYLQVDENEDGGIMIQPNNQELMTEYVDAAKRSNEDDTEFINPAEFQNFGFPQTQEDDDFDPNDNMDEFSEEVIPYASQENLDRATYNAMTNALANQLEQENQYLVPQDSSDESIPEEYYLPSVYSQPQDIVTNDVRKIRKRGEETYNQIIDDPVDMSEYVYYPEENQPYIDEDYNEEEGNTNEGDILIDPSANVISKLGISGGLGSNIFNRNERLDVKKPGPFYKNSANNFFLDKMAEGSLEDYQDKENDTKSKNVGQVEYEMPLLAPVKDKRELVLDQVGENEGNNPKNFVHIALKNRFNTWNQGSAFIKLLAKEFNLPPHALTDRMIENQHVQFHVDSNPQNVDAIQMAKRIDQDQDLHAKIGDQIGVEIDRASPGHRDDIKSVLFPSGLTNFNLLLLVVVAASTTAAVLVAAIVLMLVKRRKRILRKQGLMQNGAEEAAQDEYKQLCRDWSKTSKKVDAGNKFIHKKVQNQDSRESTRSST